MFHRQNEQKLLVMYGCYPQYFKTNCLINKSGVQRIFRRLHIVIFHTVLNAVCLRRWLFYRIGSGFPTLSFKYSWSFSIAILQTAFVQNAYKVIRQVRP
jgi:hypothetical protein